MKRSPFIRLLHCILRNVLSGNGKRILFLVTTYMKLTKADKLVKEDWSVLNNSLSLSRDLDALVFPAALRDLVWGVGDIESQTCGVDVGKVMSRDTPTYSYKKICRMIVEASPTWLRYGRRDDMYKDLVAMVSIGRGDSVVLGT